MRNCREFFCPSKVLRIFLKKQGICDPNFDFSVLNSAEKELTCIYQIQVKIGAAVADSVFFLAKFLQNYKNN
jgi:hypothetical protein